MLLASESCLLVLVWKNGLMHLSEWEKIRVKMCFHTKQTLCKGTLFASLWNPSGSYDRDRTKTYRCTKQAHTCRGAVTDWSSETEEKTERGRDWCGGREEIQDKEKWYHHQSINHEELLPVHDILIQLVLYDVSACFLTPCLQQTDRPHRNESIIYTCVISHKPSYSLVLLTVPYWDKQTVLQAGLLVRASFFLEVCCYCNSEANSSWGSLQSTCTNMKTLFIRFSWSHMFSRL